MVIERVKTINGLPGRFLSLKITRCLAFVYNNLSEREDLKRLDKTEMLPKYQELVNSLVGRRRLELPTNGLKVRCSTN